MSHRSCPPCSVLTCKDTNASQDDRFPSLALVQLVVLLNAEEYMLDWIPHQHLNRLRQAISYCSIPFLLACDSTQQLQNVFQRRRVFQEIPKCPILLQSKTIHTSTS